MRLLLLNISHMLAPERPKQRRRRSASSLFKPTTSKLSFTVACSTLRKKRPLRCRFLPSVRRFYDDRERKTQPLLNKGGKHETCLKFFVAVPGLSKATHWRGSKKSSRARKPLYELVLRNVAFGEFDAPLPSPEPQEPKSCIVDVENFLQRPKVLDFAKANKVAASMLGSNPS